jgi:hypothetical protein
MKFNPSFTYTSAIRKVTFSQLLIKQAVGEILLSAKVTCKLKILLIIVTVGVEALLSENRLLDASVKEVCCL